MKEGKIYSKSLSSKVLKDKEFEKSKSYFDVLKEALESEDKNIAITGSYGAGKSSIIRTFFHHNKEYKPLMISLATFKDELINNIELKQNDDEFKTKELSKLKQTLDNKTVKNESINSEHKENSFNQKEHQDDLGRKIELSILQQIFYSVSKDKIPDSRLKRINNFGEDKINGIAIKSIIALMSILYLIVFKGYENLHPSSWTFKFSDIVWVHFISLLITLPIFVWCFYVGIKKGVRFLASNSINKLNFLKGEIELGKDIDQSIFNQHLDEILYFFEKTEFNILVIEDLDRFRNTEVFTKLREINLLLNNTTTIKKDKITFLYAVRDEIFIDEERTKFFDRIVPIIPYINSSNAKNQLNKLIKEYNLEDDFKDEDDFKRNIVRFIDDIDMRLLINIFNEYCVYKGILNKGDGLKAVNLMAYIIYKNLYPSDFVDLSRNKGNLYDLLNSKDEYVLELNRKKLKEIEKLKEKISIFIEEKQLSIINLRKDYILEISKLMNHSNKLIINSGHHPLKSIVESDELFEMLTNESRIKYYGYHSGYGNVRVVDSGKTFSNIENLVDSKYSYQDRVNVIENKEDKLIELRAKIDLINKELKINKELSIKNVLIKIDTKGMFNSFSNSKLVKRLILNGYIDENFNQYISIFHESGIIASENKFISYVLHEKLVKYDYKLTNIKNVINEIPLLDFSKVYIFNYSLVDFIIKNKNDYQLHFDNIVDLLSIQNQTKENLEHSYDFIYNYFQKHYDKDSTQSRENARVLLIEIVKRNFELWVYFYDGQFKYPIDFSIRLLNLLFKYVDVLDICNLNIDNKMNECINRPSKFFHLTKDIDIVKLELFIKENSISFKYLEPYNEVYKEIYYFTYKNNYYELNENNIKRILEHYSSKYDSERFYKANFTEIMTSESEFLVTRINENLKEYLNNVYLKLDVKYKEEDKHLIALLNYDLGIELKKYIVKKQSKKLNNITQISDFELLSYLIEENLTKPTWYNLKRYFDFLDGVDADETMANFIQNNVEELAEQKFDFSEDKMNHLDTALIFCDLLNIADYKKITKLIDTKKWKFFAFSVISEEKGIWLLNNGNLSFHSDQYVSIVSEIEDLEILNENYHLTFQDEIIKNVSLSEIDINNIMMMINSSEIKEENKVVLINSVDYSSLSLEDKIDVRNAMDILLVNNIETFEIPIDIIIDLLKGKETVTEQINLMNIVMEYFNAKNVIRLLEHLNEDYRSILNFITPISFPNSIENENLAKGLEKKGIISKFNQRTKKIVMYSSTVSRKIISDTK